MRAKPNSTWVVWYHGIKRFIDLKKPKQQQHSAKGNTLTCRYTWYTGKLVSLNRFEWNWDARENHRLLCAQLLVYFAADWHWCVLYGVRLIEFYYYFECLLSSLMDCNQFYETVINIHSSYNLKNINKARHVL